MSLLPSNPVSTAKVPSNSRAHTNTSLAADEAKSRGEAVVRTRTPEDFLPSPAPSLDDEFDQYSVATIVPIAKATVVLGDQGIVTLYNARIIERLTPPRIAPLPSLSLAQTPQAIKESGLLPTSSSEMLLIIRGGEASMSGMSVVETNPREPPLTLRKQYLIFFDDF